MSRQGRKSHNSSEVRNSAQAWPKLNLPGWDADTTIALLVVARLTLAVNFTGLNRGQSGGHSWEPHSIAGSNWPIPKQGFINSEMVELKKKAKDARNSGERPKAEILK